MLVKDFLANFKRVIEEGEPVVVERRAEPIAVVVPLSKKLRETYPALWKEAQLLVLMKRAEQSGLDLEEVAGLLRRRLKNGKEG